MWTGALCATFFSGVGSSDGQISPDTVVFIVHGTYDATGEWVKEVSGSRTFASELKRGIGSGCIIEPFLWKTSVKHEVRTAAAERLAKQLDQPGYADKRVIVVGHSHGGNVALEAIGRCKRAIDVAVCLSTPHIFLRVKTSTGHELALPVYCSLAARGRIDSLLAIAPVSDDIVDLYAAFRKGLDEQTAIELTHDWRKRANDPRLVDDGGAVQEIVEDILDISLSTNLEVDRELNVADHNVTLACKADGMDAHGVIHSTRMGYVLGSLMRSGLTKRSLDYLSTTVLTSDSDEGNPLSDDQYRSWEERYRDGFDDCGWTLREISITGTKQTKWNKKKARFDFWDADKTWPDIRFRLLASDGKTTLFESDNELDDEVTTWRPYVHLASETNPTIVVTDRDLVRHDKMGSFEVDTGPPPTRSYDSREFSVEMVWQRAHY